MKMISSNDFLVHENDELEPREHGKETGVRLGVVPKPKDGRQKHAVAVAHAIEGRSEGMGGEKKTIS